MFGPRIFLFSAAILAILLAGCNSSQQKTPSIGTAYAGPATLKLHKEIDSKSATIATVHHGEKLAIIGQRRRWYKVRTAAGAEGWTSDRELLDEGQMKRLRQLAKETGGMPSQGVATTFGTLNIHSEPSRQSPSFAQVKEHEKVDVIAHRVAARNGETARRELVPPAPKPRKKAGNQKSASKIPTPPAPAAPQPPAGWLELSKEPEPEPSNAVPAQPGPVDDWSLVRTESGESGWVLTSGLYLTIPDEVAQYAEGRRITSYFSLGKIADGDQMKDIWLWTTAESLGEDHDFDGYRVFVWSLRHHRYETAYIQRRERGFFPVLAKTGEFSVCLERDDGSRVRKRYTMTGNAVRPAGDQPCSAVAEQEAEPQPQNTDSVNTRPGKQSLVERIEEKAKGLVGK